MELLVKVPAYLSNEGGRATCTWYLVHDTSCLILMRSFSLTSICCSVKFGLKETLKPKGVRCVLPPQRHLAHRVVSHTGLWFPSVGQPDQTMGFRVALDHILRVSIVGEGLSKVFLFLVPGYH